jgi:2-keto-myo-inositol isomerase
MRPALAQVCSLNAPLERAIEDYAAGKCPAIELWFTMLETYLERHLPDDLRRLLGENEMAAPVASYQGGLLGGGPSQRDAAGALFRRRLELCRTLGIGTMVLAADLGTSQAPGAVTDLQDVVARLAAAARAGEQAGVRLALEFQARSPLLNNLETAAAVVDQIANPYLGICLDLFHYHTGPSKPEDLAWLTADNLLHVQLCDLAGTPRELATDSMRVLPGDGDIPIEPIVCRLREISYAGHVSVELMNPQIWQVPALQFGEVAMTALRRALGQAQM